MDKERIASIKEVYQSYKKIIIPLIIIIIAVSSSFITFFALQISLNTPTPVVVVSSGSMTPTINEGDLLFVRGAEGSEIQNGSIIVFQAQWSGAPLEPVVHRVINIQIIGGYYYFETKGDYNEYPDPTYVREDFVYGIVIGGIPFIGWVKLFFDRSGLLYPLIIIIFVGLIISMIWDYIKEKEDQKKPEDRKDLKDFKDK